MNEASSTVIRGWIERLRAGDESAREHLLACASGRLERLTRKMMKDYPVVHRWEQTEDILQNALMRLHRALGDVKPESTLDFFRLATLQIRRELVDMARRYSGPEGIGANHASEAGVGPVISRGDDSCDPARLAEWSRFHEAAGLLPEEDRQVFDLLYYQGMSQDEAAELLAVSSRTVKRRWQSARLKLFDALGGQIPGG